MMMILILFFKNWIYLFYLKSAVKFTTKYIYIYLGIVVISMLIKVCFVVLSLEFSSDFFFWDVELENRNFIFYLENIKKDTSSVIENKNIVDLVNVNNKESEVKNLNPLKDIHKWLLSADKSYVPSYFQESCIPSKDVPVYGDKLVTFKSSSLLQDRNLPNMSIEIPKNVSIGKLAELHKAIEGADEAVKLYDSQYIKFNDILSGIQNGTEKFYPNEAKPLMETYLDLVAKLSNQQKIMANEAINQLSKLDPKFTRDLYVVNSGKSTWGQLVVQSQKQE